MASLHKKLFKDKDFLLDPTKMPFYDNGAKTGIIVKAWEWLIQKLFLLILAIIGIAILLLVIGPPIYSIFEMLKTERLVFLIIILQSVVIAMLINFRDRIKRLEKLQKESSNFHNS